MDTAVPHPGADADHAEFRLQRHVEAAIAVQMHRRRAVEFGVRVADNRHRHFGAVLRGRGDAFEDAILERVRRLAAGEQG